MSDNEPVSNREVIHGVEFTESEWFSDLSQRSRDYAKESIENAQKVKDLLTANQDLPKQISRANYIDACLHSPDRQAVWDIIIKAYQMGEDKSAVLHVISEIDEEKRARNASAYSEGLIHPAEFARMALITNSEPKLVMALLASKMKLAEAKRLPDQASFKDYAEAQGYKENGIDMPFYWVKK